MYFAPKLYHPLPKGPRLPNTIQEGVRKEVPPHCRSFPHLWRRGWLHPGPRAGGRTRRRPSPAARATPSPVLLLQGAANYRSAGFASHAACPRVPLGTRWLRGSEPPTPASPRFTVCELLELEQPSPKIASTDIETNSQKRSDIHAGYTETGKAPCARFTRSGE